MTPAEAPATDRAALHLPSAPRTPELDAVEARTYAHPCLPGRPVVKLVPHQIAHGADAEAAVGGFRPGGDGPVVALARKRHLGFPQWTLVHDPKNGPLVLSVMPGFRKAAKQAASKPGNAKDAFEDLAKTFARRSPGTLPTWWEQVARAFVDAGNPKLAATCFDKARTAEETFGLAVDGARLADVFLEFALAGAVTVKAITAWGKNLAAAEGPAVALERLLDLAVQRTVGGLPPWASLAKDLRSLAAAAKRKPDEVQERFLGAAIGAPALDRAAPGFWEDHAAALVRLAGRDPGFRRQLLLRFPRGSAREWQDVDEALADRWLGLLHESGALAEADRDWFERFSRWAPREYGPRLSLGRRLLPGTGPLAIGGDGWVDVQFLDLLLELGVPFTIGEDVSWDLGGWADTEEVPARYGLPAEPRPRPLAWLARSEHAEALRRRLARKLDEPRVDERARDSAALAPIRRAAILERIAAVDAGRVPAADGAKDELVELPLASLREDPEFAAAIGAIDLARVLARSARDGVLAELHWPPFDAAVAELAPDGDADGLVAGGWWPWLAVASARRVVALGPDGARTATRDLKLPKKARLVGARAWRGHLLVGWREEYEGRASWDGGPPTEADVPWRDDGQALAVEAENGALFAGGAPFRIGDPGWPSEGTLWSDGERCWNGEREPVDPATARVVPGAPPSFLPEGGYGSWLLPTPSGPIGLRQDPDGATALDGRVWKGTDTPDVLVELPGDPRPRALVTSWRQLALHGPDGEASDEGPKPLLPPWYWTRAVPRDPAASNRLRSATPEDGRAWLEARRAGLPIPGFEGPIGDALARLADQALAVETALHDWWSDRTAAAAAPSDAGPTADDLDDALGPLSVHWTDDVPPGAVVAASAACLRGEGPEPGYETGFEWLALLPVLPAFGWALARPGLSDPHRAVLRSFLAACLELPDAAFHHQTFSFPDLSSPVLRTRTEDGERSLVDRWSGELDGVRFLAVTDDTWSDEGPFTVELLAFARVAPAGATRERDEVVAPPDAATRARLRALLDADPRPTSIAVGRFPERTGLQPASAALVLAACPELAGWRDQRMLETAAVLGIAKAEALAARDELRALRPGTIQRLLVATAPADPAAFGSEALADAVGAWFAETWGRRIPVDPALRKDAGKLLDDDAILDLLSFPRGAPELAGGATYTVGEDLDVSVTGEGLDLDLVRTVVQGVPWARMALRGDDPLLAHAGWLVERVRAVLAEPGLVVGAGSAWASGKKAKAAFAAAGGQGGKLDRGGLAATYADESLTVVVRPSRYAEEDAAALAALAEGFDDDDLRRSAATLALARSLAWPPPVAGYEADPRLSAPALVEEAAAAKDLGSDAAVLWLQTLALPWPTKADVLAWNGWAPKVYAAACAELVAAKLVVEAKRAKAGRAHFLPGPWEDGPAPFERWKAPLLRATERRGELTFPFGAPRVLDPPGALFQAAFARVRKGELPRFG